ncbi:MAG: serine/threonine-protein phosphatase [Planctomycetes bacterium]|nr:serine/threonine-protein phosphatase [Planctomycetota bacterium]
MTPVAVETSEDQPAGVPLPPSLAARARLGGFTAGLRGSVGRFVRWLDGEILPAALMANDPVVSLDIADDGQMCAADREGNAIATAPEATRRAGAFLASAGLRRLELDNRLEAGQIVALLRLLRAAQRGLACRGTPPADSLAGRLTGPAPVQYACMRLQVAGGTLTAAYSYRTTPFSRIVRWYVRRHRRFADHRALFHGAPRLAVLVALIALAPLVTLAMGGSVAAQAIVTLAVAAVEFALVYVLVMLVGSVEYDNEQSRYRLTVAYDGLDRHAQRIDEDLQRARIVQQKMLPDPDRMPLADHLQWAGSFVPAGQVGGDYYDAMATGPGRVAIIFGDVSGHDMAAAFVTAILKTGFQSWLDEGGTLAEFVARLNRRLYELIPDDSFAAVFMAIYEAGPRELTYVNGGHHPEPWLLEAAGGPPRSLSDARAMLLGVMESIPIAPARLRLAAGDTVVFVTDGVIEAVDGDGEFYGCERLGALLDASRDAPVEALVERVVADVGRHAGDRPQRDDQTVLAFRVRGDPR